MNDAIAAMRARIRLERPQLIADELGGGEPGWTPAGEVWARIEANAAGSEPAHDGVRSWTRFIVRIWRGGQVAAGWRAIWNERALGIRGVIDDGGAFVTLLCEEQSP